MDIIAYDSAHTEFRRRLRAFLEAEVTPFADRWEAEGLVPRDVWRKMGQEGFLCPTLPKAYGGLGADFRYSLIVGEEMAKTNHYGLMPNLHSDIVVPYIASFAQEAVKEAYLPKCASGEVVTALAMTEPGAGSDLAGITTTAVEDDGGVVLSGSKTFISNGILADVVVVAARNPDIKNAYEGISLYLVEAGAPGFEKGRKLEKMGFRSQDTAELFFSGCKIPKANRLGQKGQGFFMMMQQLQQERLACAVAAVPAAERILAETTDHCRNVTENGRPKIRSQAVQFALVEMATEVKIGRTFVEKLVMDHIEGRSIIAETAMAKYWTTEMVRRVADRCLDLFGDFGMYETCPVVRAWRDVRVMSIFAGTNEIMKGIAAKFMGF